jgi:hypothetical protein
MDFLEQVLSEAVKNRSKYVDLVINDTQDESFYIVLQECGSRGCEKTITPSQQQHAFDLVNQLRARCKQPPIARPYHNWSGQFETSVDDMALKITVIMNVTRGSVVHLTVQTSAQPPSPKPVIKDDFDCGGGCCC